jgi:hypothetical protein
MDPILVLGALTAVETTHRRVKPAPNRGSTNVGRVDAAVPAWRRATATTLVRMARRLEPSLA